MKATLGRLDAKEAVGAKAPEKANPTAKPAEPVARILEIEGLVLGERSMLEGYLSSYVLKLKGSPLFKETTVQRSVVEVIPQNTAEGEVLHFVLNVKLQ
jgi:hypothetical protein